ncbi:hypothetical protein [Micromonospora sp. NPDC006431]|uniref:hypothetical protein n=1 Tax=Micromonospora sp. NPDC006431 TaxID=3364235 RepID=UPI0036C0E3E2
MSLVRLPNSTQPPTERGVRLIPIRKVVMAVIAVSVSFTVQYDVHLATQILLGVTAFSWMDRIDSSIR